MFKATNRKRAGKKGSLLASPLVDMWAFIVFVIVAILFLILMFFTRTGIQYSISAEYGKINAETSFMSFLRAKSVQMENGKYASITEVIPIVDFDDENSGYFKAVKMASEDFVNSYNFESSAQDACRAKVTVRIGEDREIVLVDKFREMHYCNAVRGEGNAKHDIWASTEVKVPVKIGLEKTEGNRFHVVFEVYRTYLCSTVPGAPDQC
ncbi:MAG: hypothetical protein QS98_C0006G0023 [archaeon GW2011_AR3]|nr:MAG: hypothetical protein QS98_C0006G0023 [archaeon GW2011_AR3]MBS3109216.1 hypothetical protein [Candidatus Woesearchaeota archaeon]